MKSANISRLCDRNFGIEADGEIFALPGINGTDYTMRILNYDGSEPEMCGNGCFARFIAELENLQGKQSFTLQTGARLIVPEIREDGKVKDDMGQAKPNLKAPDDPTKLTPNKDQAAVKAKLDVNGLIWNGTCDSMGNPQHFFLGANLLLCGLRKTGFARR
ncbi:hypothetical protein ACS0TY_018098 [Phlomoides rotata]